VQSGAALRFIWAKSFHPGSRSGGVGLGAVTVGKRAIASKAGT
jgi:hypothetical protein